MGSIGQAVLYKKVRYRLRRNQCQRLTKLFRLVVTIAFFVFVFVLCRGFGLMVIGRIDILHILVNSCVTILLLIGDVHALKLRLELLLTCLTPGAMA
jgi:hypothetical protein